MRYAGQEGTMGQTHVLPQRATASARPLPARPPLPSEPSVQPPAPTLIDADKISVFYGDNEAIKQVALKVPQNSVTAFIGPSGCGKSTFLRSINRLNDLIPGCRVA